MNQDEYLYQLGQELIDLLLEIRRRQRIAEELMEKYPDDSRACLVQEGIYVAYNDVANYLEQFLTKWIGERASEQAKRSPAPLQQPPG